MVLATDASELAVDAGRRALALLPAGVEVVLVTVAGVDATWRERSATSRQ